MNRMREFLLEFLSYKLVTTILVLVLLSLLVAGCSSQNEQPMTQFPMDEQITANAFEHTSTMTFIPNHGQLDPVVAFHTHNFDSSLFFTNNSVVLTLPTGRSTASYRMTGAAINYGHNAKPVASAVLTLQFENTGNKTEISGANSLPGIANYFRGNDPANWHTNLPTYNGITYKALYPGVDLNYDGQRGMLKGTFVVAPGTDPEVIQWHYEGMTSLHLDDASGDLLIVIPNSRRSIEIVEQAPVAWQEISGKRVSVDVQYVYSEGKSVGLEVGKFDPSYSLIIDPTLDYSTYLGDTEQDVGIDIAVDKSAGYIYITGNTESVDFPTKLPQQATDYSDRDVFVAKIDPSKTGAEQLVYSTVIGGTDSDTGNGIAVDAAGNAHVAGETDSTDLPTPNGFQTTNGGGGDSFYFKLNPAGTNVVYGTYFGGTEFEEALGVAIDNAGKAYIAALTDSDNFPKTANAYQSAIKGARDVSFTIIDSSKSGAASLVYSSFFGGTSDDEAFAVAADSSGRIYATGQTTSSDLPTQKPVQAAYAGNTSGSWEGDSFVTVIDPNLTGNAQLVFSTYLGGGGGDMGLGIQVDGAGQIFVAGITHDQGFPRPASTASNTQISAEDPDYDVFIVKINPTSTAIQYTTLFGGSKDDAAGRIALDNSGNVYVTGATLSDDFQTVEPIQQDFAGGPSNEDSFWGSPSDALIAKLNASGQVVFSTFLGGDGDESGFGIDLDNAGGVYVVGATSSSDWQTKNPLQDTYGGDPWDVFIVKLGDLGEVQPTSTNLYLPLVTR